MCYPRYSSFRSVRLFWSTSTARKRKRFVPRLLLIIATLVAVAAATPVAQATTPPAVSVDSAISAVTRDTALEQDAKALAADEGTSLEAAAGKLRWQARAAEFISRAEATESDTFGGAWLNDDVVHVLAKGGDHDAVSERLQTLAVSFSLNKVNVSASSFTLAELVARQRQIDALLAVANVGAPSTLDIEPDVKRNRLILRVPPQPTSRQQEAETQILRQFSRQVEKGVKGLSQFQACSGPWCDPPLRGGIGLIYGSVHGCTGRFIVASASDSKRYLTTQKHCLDGLGYGTWKSAFSNSSHHNIGAPHNWNNSDLAILSINNPTGWAAGPYIRIAGNTGYPVTSLVRPAVGARTCVAGSHSWGVNRCGTVSYGVATREGITNTMRATLPSCTVGGDSGAPYFSYGQAHGTHIGLYGTHYCGTWFTSAADALWSLNVRMLVTG